MGNKKEITNEIRKLGYSFIFGIDYNDGNLGIQIIPKKYSDGTLRINKDLVNLLKNYNFEFNELIIINGVGTFAIFKETKKKGGKNE